MKVKLCFYDIHENYFEEIIEVPDSQFAGMTDEEAETYLANNHLVEFVFDHIDASVQILGR